MPKVSKGNEFVSMFISDDLWEIQEKHQYLWHTEIESITLEASFNYTQGLTLQLYKAARSSI